MRTIAVEGLVNFGNDARPEPWLAEKWESSADGLTWNIWLRPNAKFHDGTAVDAHLVRDLVEKELPAYLGPAFSDVESIRATSNVQLEFKLKRRSTFLLEGLELFIERPNTIGTGPFLATNQDDSETEMRANASYHQGPPKIDRIVLKPYPSVRSAWADMLRGQVDMLYDVGADALDLMEGANTVKVFTFPRPYAYLIILNTNRPALRNPRLRRAMNEAIDRRALIDQAQEGRGVPADSPVWPSHWALDPGRPGFSYNPQFIPGKGERIRFKCIFVDAADERMALAVQRQLRAVGVDVEFEQLTIDKFRERVVKQGDFDSYLASAQMGPNLLRQYQFWRSNASYNWSRFTSESIDAAFDVLGGASNDEEYKRGVAAFQRAVVDDPPAIFLTWTERTRAVSSRFDVVEQPGRDILGNLRLWRPVIDGADRN